MPSLPLGVPLRHGAVALVAGLAGAAALPPVGIWSLTFVSVALFLWLLRDQDTRTARNLGLVYGLAFAAGTMYWLAFVFGVLVIPFVAIMAAYFGLLACLVALTRGRTPWVRALLVAVFAVGIEWLRGDAWYLRFPWYTPPHALAAEPMWVAPARWLGTYGLSLVIWFIAAAGAFWRPLVWAGFLLLPLWSYLLPEVYPPHRRVVLVQAEGEAAAEPLFPSIPAVHMDLAVLPELAYQRTPKGALVSETGPQVLAEKLGCPVVFGALQGDFNVAALIDADGKLIGTFPKQRPVPMMQDGSPGDRRPVFPTDQGVLGIAICYDFDAPEVAASLARDGATVFVLPTMDAISWSEVQHVHHELLVRLRAVENDRWILRAASSGRSEVIDPHGRPSDRGVEIGERGFVILPYGHRTTVTVGSWLSFLGPAAGAATGLFLVGRAVSYLRSRQRLSARD